MMVLLRSSHRKRGRRRLFVLLLLFLLPLTTSFQSSQPQVVWRRPRDLWTRPRLKPPPRFWRQPELCATTTSTGTSSSQPNNNATEKPLRGRGWDYRIQQLQSFYAAHGHSQVTANSSSDDYYPGLYQWTRTVRSRYRHQVLDNDEDNEPQPYQYAPLTDAQLAQLAACDFVWEVRQAAWQRRYEELVAFHRQHGHCRVTATNHSRGLVVWVRHQRRSFQELTPQRRRLLQELDLLREHIPSRRDAWQSRYQQLVEFYQQHGHSNVPQPQSTNNSNNTTSSNNDDDDTLQQLGHWCMNQRRAYRQYLAGTTTALTPERLEQLEAVDFQWNVRQYKWQSMLQRLQDYYQQHGHVNIPVDGDDANQDLRLWLIWQRYLYNCRERMSLLRNNYNNNSTQQQQQQQQQPQLISDERIRALEEAIPQFAWKARESSASGPTSQDWANLFDAMRDKGLQPGMRPKQHWFEGINPFSINVKSTYTEQDLLELWNADSAEDDEEDDWGGGFGQQAWYND